MAFVTTISQPAPLLLASGSASPYGKPIPILYGRARVEGVPIWSSNLRNVSTAIAIAGAPGGATGASSGGADFAVMFGEPSPQATSVAILRLWADGVLIYDRTAGAGLVKAANLNFTVYPGSRTQAVDPTIAASVGANAPAFRGRVYAVFKNYNLSAGTFPTIVADIAVDISTTQTVRVKPYLASDVGVPGYGYNLVDWKRGKLLAFDTSTHCDVYDIRYNRLVLSGTLTQPLYSEYALTLSYKNQYPYYYSQKADLSNGNIIYAMDYTTNSVVGTFGREVGFFGSSNLGFAHPGMMIGAKGCCGYAELVIVGTIDQDLGVLGVSAGGTLSFFDQSRAAQVASSSSSPTMTDAATFAGGTSGVWGSLGGGHITAMACAETPSGNVHVNTGKPPTPIDTSLFTIVYYANGTKIMRAIVSRYTAVEIISLPISYFVASQNVYNYLSQDMVQKQPTGARQMLDLGAGWTINQIACGPIENPYVTVIATGPDGFTYCNRYDTVWSLIPDPVQLTAAFYQSGTLATYYAGLINYFTLVTSKKIPSANWADRALNARMSRNYNTSTLGYCSDASGGAGIWNVLDLFSCTYTPYPISGASVVDADTGASYGSINFDREDIYDDTTGTVYYAVPRSTGSAPYPGAIRLFSTVTSALNLGVYLRLLCATAGYDYATQTDAIGLGNININGGIINTSVKLIDLVSQICALFRVDILQRPGKITFIKRTRGAGIVIDGTVNVPNDIALTQSSAAAGSADVKIERKRDTIVDMPSMLVVDYIDFDNNSAIGTQTAKRSKFPIVTTDQQTFMKLSVPVIMSAGDCLFWATQALFDMWAGATVATLRLPPKYLYLEATDFLKVILADGTTYLAKIEKQIINADNSQTVDARTFAQFVDLGAVPASDVPLQPLLYVPEAQPALMLDNMLMADADNTDGTTFPVYYATKQPANVEQLSGSTFLKYAAVNGANVGQCRNALTYRGSEIYATDDVSRLTVNFDYAHAPVFLSLSDTDWLAGINVAAVGDAGRWEIVYWKNSTQNADGSWTFDTFARGRHGTDITQSAHKVGEWFVVLSLNVLRQVVVPIADRNVVHTYKTVTIGMTETDTTNVVQQFAYSAGALKPLAPSNRRAVNTAGDYVLTWTRRDRLSSELHDLDAVTPMSEASLAYSVDIVGPGGTTVVRTLTGITTETVTYTAAMATADGFTNPLTSLAFVVYQISAVVGRGYPAGGIVNVE